PPVLYKAGTGPQNNIDGYGRNRWGDYSYTTLDPVDQTTFWTIQEYGHSSNIWGTYIGVIQAGVPDCDENEVPDDCDIDCGPPGGECDVAGCGTSLDCNTNGVPDTCEEDCNDNGIPDDCDVRDSTSLDCNSNFIPDECEVDCNDNDIPDDCDIAAGTSLDCNGNIVPDGCDIGGGTSVDCNANSIPDECDISGGGSGDCQNNGIPDECDVLVSDCQPNGIPDACDIGAQPMAISFPLNSDPGWATEGDWAWGEPTGSGGAYGSPDPTSGYTGRFVYGYNLNGDYPNDLPERNLTSTPISCTGLHDVHLSFWRWLGVEQPAYDHAYVQVSNDGVNWAVVWENDVEIADSSWVFQEFDISAVADGQPAVQLRWTMGETDGGWTYCGWNIDDITIQGVAYVGGENDCNNNAVPDDCDIIAGTSQDCNTNGSPDDCDIAAGTSQDTNSNGIPDECEIASPLPEPGGVAKNRYISFQPNNGGMSVAFRVQLTASQHFPGSVGTTGWVGEPDANDVSRVVNTAYYTASWPAVVHVGDCKIVPAAAYEVRATLDAAAFSVPLTIPTVPEPTPAKWADCVGELHGTEWTAPNGTVNFDDVMAAVQYFVGASTKPHLTRVDIEPEVPNVILNFTDIFQIVLAFQGEAYPFQDPAGCP
ncbi:MAG: immune inhibitor A, partial [Planctomycetes bacterium]|nr:immune inhibitor A [Planctomycetota bacterium]